MQIYRLYTAYKKLQDFPSLPHSPASYQWVPRGSFLGAKTDQSLPSSAEVKNDEAIPPLPHKFCLIC
jgi:hypothetical protein